MKKLLTLIAVFTSAFATGAQAKIVDRTVAYEQGGTQLKGELVYDDARTAKGKLPGVLVIPEWWGINDYAKGRAKQLAEMGYIAFVVDMYGDGQSTEDAKVAGKLVGQFYGKPLMAERARAAFDQLVKSGLASPSKIAAIGFCFGGTTAMALGFSGAPLVGVVAFHAGLLKPPAGAGKVKAKLLVLQGAVDPSLKPEDKKEFEAGLEADKIDYQYVEYAGARHAFSNPDADRLGPKNGLTGEIGYNEPAARRSWQAMQTFFVEVFK